MGILDDLAAKHAGGQPAGGGILDRLADESGAGKPGWDATGVSFKGGKPTGGSRRDVMGIATPSERRRPVTPPTRKQVATVARPILEGGLAVGGALLGSGAGPAGTVVGAGLGYASGARGADIIEGKPTTLTNVLGQSAQDIATGATIEMGGQVAGKALAGGVNLLRQAKLTGLPFSDKRNAYRAAQQFAAAQEPGSPVAAAANAARQAETKELVNRLQPTVTPTPGQGSGNYRSAALEQSMSSKDPAFAERLKYRDAELNKAAVNNLTRTLGKPAELPTVQPASVTGEAQVKAVKGAMEPVLSKEAAMWADVPTYPMPRPNLSGALRELKGEPISKNAQKTIFGHGGLVEFAERSPKTVQGMQSVEGAINDEITAAMRAGDRRTARSLEKLKQAVKDDFTAMGEAAETGDIALHNGQIVYPSKLRAELANVEERLAAEQAKPDAKAMAQALMGKGQPAMRQTAEKEADFVKRITKDYERVFPGQPVPTEGGAAGKQAAELTTRRNILQEQLANLQPAEDVAAKYSAAKKYSREEKFERFYRGAVKDVLGTGDQASGLRIPPEQVPAKFFTPQGSKDLVKAVGREAAAEQSAPHVVEQLISKTVDANTGVMNIPRATAWMRQNADALNTLGLTRSVEQTIKGQIPRAIEAELETKAVDVLGNPAATTLQAAKIIKKFGPSIERMYGSKGMQALKDYGKMMEIISRNKYVSYAKGSTTVEKGAMQADMAEKVSTLAAVATGHGWVFSATKNIAKSLMGPALNFSKAQVNALLQEALINPTAAEALMKIAKAKPAEVSAMAPDLIKPLVVQLQVSAMQPAPLQEEPNAP